MPSMRALALGAFAVLGLVAGCGGGGGEPPQARSGQPARSAVVGLQDDTVYKPGQDPAERVAQIADAGAKVMRVDLIWDQVAPTRPANAEDPGDPAYRWAEYDAVVREARANGLDVLFTVWGTPAWAADPTVAVRKDQPAWARRPADPADFGAFGAAAARRYAPKGVHLWEGWNEPNIPLFLYPQYERRGGRWVATSPRTYAGLQRAFFEGVKGADPAAVVAGVVTAPAGDRRQSPPPVRVTPDDFVAALDAPGLRPPMDVVSHHPYPQTKPRDRTPPGRNYIDLYNLDVLTAALDRTYLRGKGLWLTEYGFGTESLPIYPLAFTPEEQSAAIADAFRRVRENPRVRLFSYYLLRDHAQWKSGLLDMEGRAKPGRDAFALPLAALGVDPAPAGAARRLVGQVRAAGDPVTAQVQWRSGDAWKPLTDVRTGPDGTFTLTLTPSRDVEVRAIWTGTGRSGRDGTWTSAPVTLRVTSG